MMQEQLIAQSPRFLSALDIAQRAANSSANILITGESGTGKEVVAKRIHELSERRKRTFVAINCSAIPEHLLESELFGYARGAFTGALSQKPGLFEEADGGTLFLDEIGDLDLSLQAKLLRVLQDKKIKRVGENQYRSLNIRIIAATHEHLREEVQKKKFREDLYFRLNVIPIEIPPLRDRIEDILPLAEYFLRKFSHNTGLAKTLSEPAKKHLMERPWPGNVRELENTIERAVVLSLGPEICVRDLEVEHLLRSTSTTTGRGGTLEQSFERLCQEMGRLFSIEELEHLYIQFALQLNQGAKEKTAKDLGIDRKTLYRKLTSARPEKNLLF